MVTTSILHFHPATNILNNLKPEVQAKLQQLISTQKNGSTFHWWVYSRSVTYNWFVFSLWCLDSSFISVQNVYWVNKTICRDSVIFHLKKCGNWLMRACSVFLTKSMIILVILTTRIERRDQLWNANWPVISWVRRHTAKWEKKHSKESAKVSLMVISNHSRVQITFLGNLALRTFH